VTINPRHMGITDALNTRQHEERGALRELADVGGRLHCYIFTPAQERVKESQFGASLGCNFGEWRALSGPSSGHQRQPTFFADSYVPSPG
jgi:hypothetical protein